MSERKPTGLFSLSDGDMVSGRRAAMRSMLVKTGLAAGAIATVVAASSTAAHASDKHNQTDNDTGARSDAPNQTDND